MRLFLRALAIGFVIGVAGCTTPDESPNENPTPVATRGGEQLASLTVPAGASTNRANTTPIPLPASGRVHSINPGLRFVVIDYTLGGMPPLQSILNVYRGDEKIGQIRLSGPERNGFVAGDIVEGLLQVDDEVRLN